MFSKSAVRIDRSCSSAGGGEDGCTPSDGSIDVSSDCDAADLGLLIVMVASSAPASPSKALPPRLTE